MEEGSQTFVALVVYVQPKFKEFKRRFLSHIDSDCKGKLFDPIERCRSVLKQSRDITFEYVCMVREALTYEVLIEMNRMGLRPALYEELLCFVEKYPDEQLKFCIIALGSETSVDGNRAVAYFWRDGVGRCFGLHCVGYVWDDDFRFLAVRE